MPDSEHYDAAPDWVRRFCLDFVPIETWMHGGLERAAAKMSRLIPLRGDEPTRLGFLAMANDGRLGPWLLGSGS